MKSLLTILAISLFSLTAAAQETDQKVSVLSWISGCWETTKPGSTTTERWGKATDNLLLGTSQTVRGTRSVAFEFLRIVNSGQGLAYVAQPSNAKEPTHFAAIRVSATEVVFENPKHDFPQRIIYSLKGPNSLHARIEGSMDGKLRGIDFPMVKISCP
ncbi:MAG: DUF6265 family protein [Pyrinomonadaceae bacterium]